MFRDNRDSNAYVNSSMVSLTNNGIEIKFFRQALRKSLLEGEIILMSKPEKYRRIGKTEMIVDFITFTEDAKLIVPSSRASIYRDLLPNDKIIRLRDENSLIGLKTNDIYVVDEVSLKEYETIKEVIDKPRGIVSIVEDYIVL